MKMTCTSLSQFHYGVKACSIRMSFLNRLGKRTSVYRVRQQTSASISNFLIGIILMRIHLVKCFIDVLIVTFRHTGLFYKLLLEHHLIFTETLFICV